MVPSGGEKFFGKSPEPKSDMVQGVRDQRNDDVVGVDQLFELVLLVAWKRLVSIEKDSKG